MARQSWQHRATRSLVGWSLLTGGVGLNWGCDAECSKQGTWCDGNVVYECTGGEGTPVVPDGDHPFEVDNCSRRGGVCRELRPTFARCVVREQECAPQQNTACFKGNPHTCISEHLLLDPVEICTEEAPCTPTETGTGASCESVDSGTGGTANAADAGQRENGRRTAGLAADCREEDVRT
jgi:hypothetical protein